ncbi:MAG: glycerate kinase [Rhodospirillaceae bacterium]|nr:glycerate kinase [Rhodospirillaceae bacterium]
MLPDPRALLRRLFDAAVDAARPALCVPPALPEPPRGRLIVVGAGKATAAMAQAVERAWPGPLEGVVVTRYGHGVPTQRVLVREAAHPVPDMSGVAATREILGLVAGAGPDDLVLCLMSGGGSALLCAPADGLSLADKQQVNRALLSCGARIQEMNAVRKHLSAVKGGRLAQAAHPARVVTLLISDVVGDDPADIASGPTVPDPTTLADVHGIVAHYGVPLTQAAGRRLQHPEAETPKPGDPAFADDVVTVVAAPQLSLEAAADAARAAGIAPVILGDAIEGEAREVGIAFAGLARQVALRGQPAAAPCVLLSGGETTVTVRNAQGRGGRNQEFALGLALALDGLAGVWALAADTDGIDGTEDVAGALVTPDTLARARAAGLDARALLRENRAYDLFQGLGDLLVTGPTLTNVNDFRAILVMPPDA